MLHTLALALLQTAPPAPAPWPTFDNFPAPPPVVPQEPVVPPALPPAVSPELPPYLLQDPQYGVGYLGAVEAPAQPFGRSSSAWLRAPRVEPTLARGSTGSLLVKIRDLVSPRGQETNVVHGVGLVTGLSGTGDSGLAARQAIANFLLTQNINLSPAQIASENVAVVHVEAELPAGIKPGRRVDVRVSSLYDAVSLVGGTLLWAELTDAQGGTVYGTASGPVTTGAFQASGDGATATRNHLTVGRVALGCKVEREVESRLVQEEGVLYLDLSAHQGGFGNAVRIAEAVNQLYPDVATPVDAMTVRVDVPGDLPESLHVAYLSSILQSEVAPEASARVVINERTGVIVVGEDVRLGRGAITKGNLTVTIAETPEISQPGPFSEGVTAEVPRTELLVEEEDRALTIVNGAATLQEVVEVLNVLGVAPRDMIELLQAMAQSGMLHAELVVQ
ncbi:MAG TPA: flagellar basal body P-ring protein FlgI [Planctomycetota bacterium]|nr:flagellar basal body P-ring protein FlgI [Planctomycetota bacterium]